MNLKSFLAGLEAAVPAVGQIVVAMHPENATEGVKIAAGVELFKLVAAGMHQIAAASASPAVPAPAGMQTAVGPLTAAVNPYALPAQAQEYGVQSANLRAGVGLQGMQFAQQNGGLQTPNA